MDLSRVPVWAWILLVVLVIIVAPIKLRIMKSLLKKKESPPDA